MVCINKCFAPWEIQKEKKQTHSLHSWIQLSSLGFIGHCSTLCAGTHSLS